jgi:hypothetical protein
MDKPCRHCGKAFERKHLHHARLYCYDIKCEKAEQQRRYQKDKKYRRKRHVPTIICIYCGKGFQRKTGGNRKHCYGGDCAKIHKTLRRQRTKKWQREYMRRLRKDVAAGKRSLYLENREAHRFPRHIIKAKCGHDVLVDVTVKQMYNCPKCLAEKTGRYCDTGALDEQWIYYA